MSLVAHESTLKVSELEGAELDYWVAKAEGFFLLGVGKCTLIGNDEFSPSKNWSQGGPIIEREQITIYSPNIGDVPDVPWSANILGDLTDKGIVGQAEGYGPTPLIAAMRAFVASKFGEKV